MCKRLADVLGWREDFVYYCEGNYYVVGEDRVKKYYLEVENLKVELSEVEE